MIYQHLKKKYAIGMMWAEHPDTAAAKSAVKSERKPYVTAESIGQQDNSHIQTIAVGHYEGEKVRGVVYSGAMAVGLVEPSTIICQSLSDDRVWFAVVHSGVPYAGHDNIVTHEEADALLKEQIAFSSTVIGDVTGAKMSLDEALSLLDSQISDGRIQKKQMQDIALRQPPSMAKIGLQAGLVLSLAAAAAAGWWIYDTQLRSASARNAALARMTKSQEEQKRLEEQKRRLIQAYNAQVAAKTGELEQAQSGPLGQWLAWEAVRKSLPLTLNGYTPDTMECGPTKCTVTWKGDGPLVRYVDKAALPNWVEDNEPSTAATSEYVIAALPASRQALPGADAVALRLRIAQLLQFTEGASVGAPQPVIVKAPPSPPETGLVQADLGFTGEVRMGVGGNTAIVKLGQALAELRAQPVALKSVRWTQLSTREPSAQIEGYWARLNTKP
jgi:pilin accessory protein (PilO)